MRGVFRVVSSGVFLSFALCVAGRPALADEPAPGSVEELRAEIEALKADHAQRLAALEARLVALKTPSPAPPPAASLAPQAAASAGSAKVFNPDIAVIGDFLGAAGSNPTPGAPSSLELHETEASFQAIVDPYARADFFLTFGPDEVGVEEGFITFPTVPGGLLVRAGRMRDAFGKVDAMHNHVLPWTDRPLVSQNLLGGEEALGDYGVSVARLIPNRLLFLEATAQLYRGESELFAAKGRGDLAYVAHLRAYRDLSESVNLDLGGSFAHGHNGVSDSSTTRLLGADLTLRWRPLRRAIYRRFVARSELVWSRRRQEPETQRAFGMYASAEYQFARRWFAGARYDWSERAEDAALADKGGSLLLTWWPSEFSQIRGQFRHTRYATGEEANELLFQLLFSIGAHGAHAF